MKKSVFVLLVLAFTSCVVEEEEEPMLASEILEGEKVSCQEIKKLFPIRVFMNEEPEQTKGINLRGELVTIMEEPSDSVYEMKFFSQNKDGELLGDWEWFKLDLWKEGPSNIYVQPHDLPSTFTDIPPQERTHLVYTDTTYTTGWMVIGVWTAEKYSYYRVKMEFDKE